MIAKHSAARSLLVGMLAAAALGSMSDDSYAQNKRFDGVSLRVATYGGPWLDGLQEQVATDMEKLGAKIEFDTGSPNEHLAKLIVARGGAIPFDVTEIDDPTLPQYVEAGVLQSFDTKNIPNISGLVEQPSTALNLIPIWAFEEGVVYNAEKFAELGILRPQRYTDLLDPKLTGRVAFYDINGANGPFAVLGFALDTGGNADNVTPGIEAMRKLGAKQFFSSSPTIMTTLISKDNWAAFMGAAWTIRMRKAGHSWANFAPLKMGDNVGIWSRGYLGLVKGSKNVEAAEYYVNRYISTAVQSVLALKLGSVAVNKDALKELDKDPLLHEILVLDPDKIANMRRVDFAKINLQRWIEDWNRIMLK
jgi:putative spermidine/putrescine transport system substrate-binding protein